MPEEVAFATKPAIALDALRAAVAAGIPKGTVLMDAGYGVDADLRREVRGLGLAYVAGVQPKITLWPSGQPRVPGEIRQARVLALGLPASAWETVTWRGTVT